jgi:hypothetical protein
MADAQITVTIASLAAGSVCFLLYIYESLVMVRGKAAVLRSDTIAQSRTAVDVQARTVSIDEISRLIDAIGRLTDSLSRAGPSLTSLIGALLFFAIAAVSSGALRG